MSRRRVLCPNNFTALECQHSAEREDGRALFCGIPERGERERDDSERRKTISKYERGKIRLDSCFVFRGMDRGELKFKEQ